MVYKNDDDNDYYVGQQNTADKTGDPLIFDCGSSGTKYFKGGVEGEKVEPTMSAACQADGCEGNYSTLDVSENGNCFAVATAGNRIIAPKRDQDAWTGFKETLTRCKTWKETPNCFFSQEGSYTVAGVQEALYEAHLVVQEKARGFISAGGASAQFGFQLCDNSTVIDAWRKFRSVSITERLWTLQCHSGTEIDERYFSGQTTDVKVRKADGADLQKKQGDDDEHVAAANSWVLGSFLGCKDSYSEFAGNDQAFAALERKRGHKDMNETEVRLWLRSDGTLTALRDFTRSWKNGCPAYFKQFVTTAGMSRNSPDPEKRKMVISDGNKNKFHGDFAAIMTRGVLSFLELVDPGKTIRKVEGNWIKEVAKMAV